MGRFGHSEGTSWDRGVTGLEFFTSGGRAAVMAGGMLRVWDVERSATLATCLTEGHWNHEQDHLCWWGGGTSSGDPGLSFTAFTLTGCGEGVTPPLDISEWGVDCLGDEIGRQGAAVGRGWGDQQLLATTSSAEVMHFDLRQAHHTTSGAEGGYPLPPAATWPLSGSLQNLQMPDFTRLVAFGMGEAHTPLDRVGAKRGTPLPSLCCLCDGGEGDWVSVGSSEGQVVVLDKRVEGGRPLYRWNAHAGTVVRVFPVARNLLLTISRDLTAVVWDLSLAAPQIGWGGPPAANVDANPARQWDARYTRSSRSWRDSEGELEDSLSSVTLPMEKSPMRAYTVSGLPDHGQGMSPATVYVHNMRYPLNSLEDVSMDSMSVYARDRRLEGGIGKVGSESSSMGQGWVKSGSSGVFIKGRPYPFSSSTSIPLGPTSRPGPFMPVMFAFSGNRVAASAVSTCRREMFRGRGQWDIEQGAGQEFEVKNMKLTPKKIVDQSHGNMQAAPRARFSGGGGGGDTIGVGSVALLPLRQLLLLGCDDGCVKVVT
ncbi:unnamed protein product [Choristocarpus tenellus]